MTDFYPSPAGWDPRSRGGLRDALAFAAFVSAGVGLMYVGYFREYSEDLFVAYIAAVLALGGLYTMYFGLAASPHKAIYNWLIMFVIFPKKELPPDVDRLLNLGLGFTTESISMYQVLDIFVVLAMALAILCRRRQDTRIRGESQLPPGVRALYFAYMLVAFVGILHFGLAIFHQDIVGDNSYRRMFLALWPVLTGLVVFQASLRFIRNLTQAEHLLKIVIWAAVLLLLEFVAAKSGLLPGSVVYYSLNWRGAFRSVLQSGDLFVGLILIASVAGALYFYITKRQIRYAALALGFAYLMIETYDRGQMAALVVTVLALLWISSRRNKWRLLLGTVLLAMTIAGYSLISGHSALQAIDEGLDRDRGRDSLFDPTNVLARVGASARGLDVFLYVLTSGAGPGNLVLFMSSPLVPSQIDWSMSPVSEDLYSNIRSGAHPTNPHNLALHLLGEYGIVALLAVLATLWTLLLLWRATGRSNSESSRTLRLMRISCYAALLGYLIYYMFQSVPQIFGLLFLLVRLAVLDESHLPAAGAA